MEPYRFFPCSTESICLYRETRALTGVLVCFLAVELFIRHGQHGL